MQCPECGEDVEPDWDEFSAWVSLAPSSAGGHHLRPEHVVYHRQVRVPAGPPVACHRSPLTGHWNRPDHPRLRIRPS